MDKILLINPPISKDNTLHLPLNLFSLHAELNASELKTDILDLALIKRRQNISSTGCCLKQLLPFIKIISEYKYIGVTTMCDTVGFAIHLAAWVKKHYPGKIIIFGGPHASLCYQALLRSFGQYINYVVVGEGEITLKELIISLGRRDDILKVKGVAYNYKGDVEYTGYRELISNLDELPMFHWESLNLNEYIDAKAIWGIEIGRGCPFKCSYCSTSEMWGRKYRTKSVERIAKEIKNIVQKTDIRSFSFMHDCLTADRNFTFKLCDEIKHIKVKFTWTIFSRCDIVDKEMFLKMKEAGCDGIFFGVESGSQRIQETIGKKIDLSKTLAILSAAVKDFPVTTVSFIVGFPDENAKDIHNTILYACKAWIMGIRRVFIFKLAPLPKTQIFVENYDKLYFDKDCLPNFVSLDFLPNKFENSITKYKSIFSAYHSVPNNNGIDNKFFFFLQECLSTIIMMFPYTLVYCASVEKLNLFSVISHFISHLSTDQFNYMLSSNVDIPTQAFKMYTRIKKVLRANLRSVIGQEILKYDSAVFVLGVKKNKKEISITMDEKAVRWLKKLNYKLKGEKQLSDLISLPLY